MTIGKNAVVIGNVSHESIGDHSVVIGPMDSKNNTILNSPMAVGFKAHAGQSGIAIGAYASAGLSGNLMAMLDQLKLMTIDQQTSAILAKLISEVNKQQPNKSVICTLWEKIKVTCSIATVGNQIIQLIEKISHHISLLVK